MTNTYFGGSKVALVVDDQPDFCTGMEHLLATLGFRAICASNGVEALQRLAREPEPPTVILVDLFMPRMDGIELIRRLRASDKPSPPIIAVTGDVHVAYAAVGHAAQSLGAQAILLKPFTREQLSKVLAFVLEKPATIV
jgi:CheY-like chemotaxis protein